MQHQSEDLGKGPAAGKSGTIIAKTAISTDDIERHIAEGKRMQAEAIAAFLTEALGRLKAIFHRPAKAGDDLPQVQDENLSRA